MPGQIARHHREDVVLHPGPLQLPGRPQHPVVGAAARPVPAEAVVAGPGSVQRQAHQKALLPEKIAPVPVQQGPVGLDGVPDRQLRRGGSLRVGHKVPEEVQPRQGGLSPLKQKGDRALRRPHRLFNQGMAHLTGHQAVVGDGADAGLVGVEAVGAAQIAAAGGRL